MKVLYLFQIINEPLDVNANYNKIRMLYLFWILKYIIRIKCQLWQNKNVVFIFNYRMHNSKYIQIITK
jgi:hypothetical protein